MLGSEAGNQYMDSPMEEYFPVISAEFPEVLQRLELPELYPTMTSSPV